MEPGIAKLLGVLSLQSLPRRLSFNFDDIFGKGFAFDEIKADVAIADGVARTGGQLDLAGQFVGRLLRYEVDGTASRISPIERSLRTTQDFDAIEIDSAEGRHV